MVMPPYRLDFELDAYFDIKKDVEIRRSDDSKIILYKSKVTNKGSIIFKVDTLDQNIAKREGIAKVDTFLDYLIVSLNIDNIMPTRFADTPILLNSEKFEKMTKTGYKNLSVSVSIVAPFAEKAVEYANTLMEKTNQLNDKRQFAIEKCLIWLRKGAEASADERFIYRWIALEALCGVLQGSYSSTQK